MTIVFVVAGGGRIPFSESRWFNSEHSRRLSSIGEAGGASVSGYGGPWRLSLQTAVLLLLLVDSLCLKGRFREQQHAADSYH